MYASFILFALAAIMNSVMDTLGWHFEVSIFRNLKKEWWNPNYSWMNVKPILGVRPDAWHLAKYGMVFCFIISAMTYKSIFGYWDIAIFFAAWWIGFEVPWRLLKKI